MTQLLMITIPGKIPIRIYPVFWIFIVLISAMYAMNANSLYVFFSWVAVIFISVVFHEMGHALTAVAFGQRAHIDLLGFGGLTHRHGKPLGAWKNFLIILNGPLAGCLLCFASYYMLTLSSNYAPKVLYTLQTLLYANIFWTAVNLIPVQPLDGGHLLKITLEGIFGYRGIKAALFISLILAVGASIFFFANQLLLGGILFMMLTYENYSAWKNSLDLAAEDQSVPLQLLLRQAASEGLQGSEEAAIQKLNTIRESTVGGVLHSKATVMLAEILSKQGKFDEAYGLLNPLRKKLSPELLRLLQDLAYKTRHWEEAIAAGTLAYQAKPQYDTAVLNAMSHAQRQEAQPAAGWLKRAIHDGLPEVSLVLNEAAFNPIRQDPAFRGLDQPKA